MQVLEAAEKNDIGIRVIFKAEDIRNLDITKGYPWSLENNREPAVKRYVASQKVKRALEELEYLRAHKRNFESSISNLIHELDTYAPPEGTIDYSAGYRDDTRYALEKTRANFDAIMANWNNLTEEREVEYLESAARYLGDGRGAQGKYAPLAITAATAVRGAARPVSIARRTWAADAGTHEAGEMDAEVEAMAEDLVAEGRAAGEAGGMDAEVEAMAEGLVAEDRAAADAQVEGEAAHEAGAARAEAEVAKCSWPDCTMGPGVRLIECRLCEAAFTHHVCSATRAEDFRGTLYFCKRCWDEQQ